MAARGARNHESNGDALTVRQQNVLALVLAGHSAQRAAELSRVPVRTIYRWMAGDAAFKAELSRRRAERFQQAADGMAILQFTAMRKLQGLLESEKESIRLGACRLVGEQSRELNAITAFEGRLAELERRARINEP
jgi:hypothetical protein